MEPPPIKLIGQYGLRTRFVFLAIVIITLFIVVFSIFAAEEGKAIVAALIFGLFGCLAIAYAYMHSLFLHEALAAFTVQAGKTFFDELPNYNSTQLANKINEIVGPLPKKYINNINRKKLHRLLKDEAFDMHYAKLEAANKPVEEEPDITYEDTVRQPNKA